MQAGKAGRTAETPGEWRLERTKEMFQAKKTVFTSRFTILSPFDITIFLIMSTILNELFFKCMFSSNSSKETKEKILCRPKNVFKEYSRLVTYYYPQKITLI